MSAHDHEHDEDLLARARRGALSVGEQQAFERVLEARPELRTAYQVGMAADRDGAVRGGDEALIGRAADAALARAAQVSATAASSAKSAQSARPARSRSANSAVPATRWALAAAVLLSVALASTVATALWADVPAWWAAVREVVGVPVAAEADAPRAAAKPRRAQVARPRVEPVVPVAPVTTAPVAVAVPPAESEAVAERAASRAERSARDTATAASELFHAANAARRDGDARRARRLYTRLIADHAGSDEAALARVSLGRLLLTRGDARGAEREFRRYLEAGGGQLSEEARVGQAQSFARMQRVAEERAAWQRLLDAHPGSVYAAQARQRLAELSTSAHAAPRARDTTPAEGPR